MTRELNCRDVGFDCDGVVQGKTDQEVLAQAAGHAQEVHGMTDDQVADPGFAQQVSAQIHDAARS